MQKVLLTGAAGRIGTSLRQHLRTVYHFRCLDIQPTEGEADVVVADVQDMDAMMRATQGMEAVIHLAANPHGGQTWEEVHGSSIGGTYTTFEAARQCGVKKIVYASTNHVVGWYEKENAQNVTWDVPIRPDSLYGVGKACSEALGRFFSDAHGISVVCLRIGSFLAKDPPQPKSPHERILRTWCSHRDLAQLVQKSIDAEGLKFAIFYGISGNTRRFWDIRNAQELVGYQPQDDAERLLEAQ
jgi:uronate dehydrogenase